MLSETTRFLAAAAIAHVKRQYLEGHPDPAHVERRLAEYDAALDELHALYGAAPQAGAAAVPVEVREALEVIVNGTIAWDWIAFGARLPYVETVRAWLKQPRPATGAQASEGGAE